MKWILAVAIMMAGPSWAQEAHINTGCEVAMENTQLQSEFLSELRKSISYLELNLAADILESSNQFTASKLESYRQQVSKINEMINAQLSVNQTSEINVWNACNR